MLKDSQEVGVKYMRLWEELEEARQEGHHDGFSEGRESGLEEGQKVGREAERLESIQKLMKTLNLTAEQAMDALQIPIDEREKYRL